LGTFFHPITLIAPSGAAETLEALVDTGSTFTTVPSPILERLGVAPFASVRLRLADGRVAERDIGEVRAEVDGLPGRTIICVFGEPDAPATLGAQTLETFLLGVDPDQKRLVPLEAWWA
jgi:predicted aspartyl protease